MQFKVAATQILVTAVLVVTIHKECKAQNCDSLLRVFKTKVVESYAGFTSKINKDSFVNFIDSLVGKKEDCITKLKKFQFFFNDLHLAVFHYDQPLRYKTNKPFCTNSNSGLEGKWINERNDKIICIERNAPGTYEATIISSKSNNVKKGLVLYEINQNDINSFFVKVNTIGRCYFGTANKNGGGEFVVSYFDKWRKINPITERGLPILNQMNWSPTMKVLQDNTFLIKIPACSFEAISIMDSLLIKNSKLIDKCRQIIIDLRENSGGTTLALEKLLPLLGPDRFLSPSGIVNCSSDNIRAFEEGINYLISDNASPEIITEDKQVLDSMKKNREGSFNQEQDTTKVSPRWNQDKQPKIGIIINYRTASSAELFVLKAIQSKHVVLFGENSAGALNTVETNSFYSRDSLVELSVPMVKLNLHSINRLTKSFKIKPDIELKSMDWIDEAKRYLNRKKIIN